MSYVGELSSDIVDFMSALSWIHLRWRR